MNRISIALLILIFLPTTNGPQQGTVTADDIVRGSQGQTWRADAELNDVFFIDKDTGWAVGAQGLILKTTNGGQDWTAYNPNASLQRQDDRNLLEKLQRLRPMQQMETATETLNVRFESIHFTDKLHGWAVGGYQIPLVNQSRAIMMRTSDGGESWQQVEGSVAPAMRKIHFQDMFTGWAIGNSSDLYPSGAIYTGNGGGSWSAQSEGEHRTWIDADRAGDALIAIDQSGQIAVLKPNGMENTVVLSGGSADSRIRFRAIKMSDDKSGWAVADQGRLFKTADRGRSWRLVGGLPSGIEGFDLCTVCETETKLWFAGTPGSKIFSYDKENGITESLSLLPNYRINRIFFLDDSTGWAVTSLGNIFHTADGGQSWKHQRRGFAQVAWMSLSNGPASIPFQGLVRYANEDPFLAACVYRADETTEPPSVVTQATDRLGACLTTPIASDQFRLQRIVREIRALKPSFIVSDGSAEVEGIVNQAIRLAASPDAFPEQLEFGGLRVWQVDRLITRDPSGSIVLDGTQVLAGSGRVTSDETAVSRALVGANWLGERRHLYRTERKSNLASSGPRSWTEGMTEMGGRMPQRINHHQSGNLNQIQHASQKRKMLEQFSLATAANPREVLRWRTQLQQILGNLNAESAGIWTLELAALYQHNGQGHLTANCLQYIVDRWPNHPFAAASMEWLVRYYASAEIGLVELGRQQPNAESSHPATSELVQRKINIGGNVQTVWIPASSELANMTENTPDEMIDFASLMQKRTHRANQLFARFRARQPELASEATMRFVSGQLTRRRNGWPAAENSIKNIAVQASRDQRDSVVRASQAAQRELEIARRARLLSETEIKQTHTSAPKNEFNNPTWESIRLLKRPQLDGNLNDPMWLDAISAEQAIFWPLPMGVTDEELAADWIAIAHDKEHLYIAARCNKLKGQIYEFQPTRRTRDPDLSRRDRIAISIDVDRDYCTTFNLAIDNRGWATDDCAGDRGWDPKWFVAVGQDETAWTVEAAIPLSELTDLSTAAAKNRTWAINLSRLDRNGKSLWNERRNSKFSTQQDVLGKPGFLPERFHLLRMDD